MAISNDAGRKERIIQQVCREHDIPRSDFVMIEYDANRGIYMLMFKAARPTADMREQAAKIKSMLDEPLRGDVARAAVPSLAVEMDRLIEQIINPKARVINVSEKV